MANAKAQPTTYLSIIGTCMHAWCARVAHAWRMRASPAPMCVGHKCVLLRRACLIGRGWPRPGAALCPSLPLRVPLGGDDGLAHHRHLVEARVAARARREHPARPHVHHGGDDRVGEPAVLDDVLEEGRDHECGGRILELHGSKGVEEGGHEHTYVETSLSTRRERGRVGLSTHGEGQNHLQFGRRLGNALHREIVAAVPGRRKSGQGTVQASLSVLLSLSLWRRRRGHRRSDPARSAMRGGSWTTIPTQPQCATA